MQSTLFDWLERPDLWLYRLIPARIRPERRITGHLAGPPASGQLAGFRQLSFKGTLLIK
jgi:hypothetical protein